MIEVRIGSGTPTEGDFEEIGWGNGSSYFLQVEYDPNGGTNYEISGISQVLSVPFAFYAQSAGNSGEDADARSNQ